LKEFQTKEQKQKRLTMHKWKTFYEDTNCKQSTTVTVLQIYKQMQRKIPQCCVYWQYDQPHHHLLPTMVISYIQNTLATAIIITRMNSFSTHDAINLSGSSLGDCTLLVAAA